MSLRARGISEWIYATGGALLLALLGVPLPDVSPRSDAAPTSIFFWALIAALASLALTTRKRH